MEEVKQEHRSFFERPNDTWAIIGVNVAMLAVMMTLFMAQGSRIESMDAKFNARFDAMTSRIDTVQMIIFDMIKDGKK